MEALSEARVVVGSNSGSSAGVVVEAGGCRVRVEEAEAEARLDMFLARSETAYRVR
jgi:hypothetical protein